MTVTELRTLLQKLEAEGKGALPAACLRDFHGNEMVFALGPPEEHKIGKLEAGFGFAEGDIVALFD